VRRRVLSTITRYTMYADCALAGKVPLRISRRFVCHRQVGHAKQHSATGSALDLWSRAESIFALHVQTVCDKPSRKRRHSARECTILVYCTDSDVLHYIYTLCLKNAPTVYSRGVDKICSILKLTDKAEATEEQFNTSSHCVGVHTIVLQVNW